MISREEVLALAALARIKLKEEEIEPLGKDISDILEYVGQINAFEGDSSKVEVPLAHNVLREDTPRDTNDTLKDKEEALRVQFPRREGGYNVVRKIIQKDE